ncbi:unnamed protein product [Spodoptera exigua]|nr:unnamed protein product [Spodoptera exigua]
MAYMRTWNGISETLGTLSRLLEPAASRVGYDDRSTASPGSRVISKWKWKKRADTGTYGEWKLQRSLKGLRPQANAGTWPGRPRSGLAGAKKNGLTDVWEKFVTKGVCWGCGGDWGYTGGLKVDIDSSEYTGYRYCYNRPGYRQRARSCEDARFIHINFVLLAEVTHFEKLAARPEPGPSVRRVAFRACLKEAIGLMFSRGCGESAMRHRDLGPEQEKEQGDLQSEIETHRDVYASLTGTGRRLLGSLSSQEDAVMLQRRLDEMNQRWHHLKAKSMAIRNRLESNAEHWSALLLSLRELTEWVIRKETELNALAPPRGDLPALLKQQDDHRAFRRQLEDKRPVVESNLLSGRQYIANEPPLSDTSDTEASRENEGDSRGYRSAEEQARELARSIRREVAKLADKWNSLVDRSDAWGRCLDDAVQVRFIGQNIIRTFALPIDHHRSPSVVVYYPNGTDVQLELRGSTVSYRGFRLEPAKEGPLTLPPTLLKDGKKKKPTQFKGIVEPRATKQGQIMKQLHYDNPVPSISSIG